ncbi:MAG: hypothetical protein WCX82_00405 [archaeon]|jgi:hypothetical protein
MLLKRKATTNSLKIKPILKYSNKYIKLKYEIFEHIGFEKKRKEILKTLPENSFAKKFYSNKNLYNEILLLKIGNEVIDISQDRREGSVDHDKKLLLKLSKKYDLSKAIQIHQHPWFGNNVASVGDVLSFLRTYKLWKIKRHYVFSMDTKLKECGRTRYELSEKLMNTLDQLSVAEIEKKYMAEIVKILGGRKSWDGHVKSSTRILNYIGIKEKIMPAEGWEFDYKKRFLVLSQE